MSKQVVNLFFLGRFGNQLHQYAFARGYCEKFGHELRVEKSWLGREIFSDVRESYPTTELPKRGDNFDFGEGNITLGGYGQRQKCVDLYTRSRVREWFRFKPEVINKLNTVVTYSNVVHRRNGDYISHGFPTVSINSYIDKLRELNIKQDRWLCEEESNYPNLFKSELSFLPDFYIMMKAKILLRSNSTFSWWAATLGYCKVYAPIIDGLCGGKEHDGVEFREGNHWRVADVDCVEELRLTP